MPKPSLFELAFYDVTVQHVNHYATENLFESYGRNRKKSLSLDVPSLYPLKKRLFVTYEALLSFGTMYRTVGCPLRIEPTNNGLTITDTTQDVLIAVVIPLC